MISLIINFKKLKKYINRQTVFAVFIAIFVIFSVLVNFKSGGLIPTWNELSAAADVNDGANLIEDNELSVHFLSVGQSDSILICFNNYNILIDAGDMRDKNTTVNYLHRCGVDGLDLIVNTHPDIDHMYELPDVLSEFPVKRFFTCAIDEKSKPSSKAYTSLVQKLDEKKVPVKYVSAGDSISFGKLHLYVISPSRIYEEFNDNSVVIKMVYKNTTWLFMGDAEKEAESDILKSGADLKCDVIKIGHHGSNSSSTKEFIEAASPKIGILSVSDSNNSLPSQKVIKRYEDAGCKLFRTDLNGNITVTSDGKTINVHTEKQVN